MSTMASARVPSEIYDQGTAKLAEIGSSTTELIISAFAYVAQVGALPQVPKPKRSERHVGVEQLSDLQEKLQRSSIKIALPESGDYRNEMARDTEADYEALS